MNATQKAKRRERRRAKRMQERAAKTYARCQECLSFTNTLNFESLNAAAKICRRGVLWKHSVQTFEFRRISNVYKLENEILQGTYKKRHIDPFKHNERGKERHISPVYFRDRVVQRALCDNSLVPIIANSIIYDNAASTKGRGTAFARERFVERMKKAVRKWEDPYIVVGDFSNYFGSISSELAYAAIEKKYIQLFRAGVAEEINNTYASNNSSNNASSNSQKPSEPHELLSAKTAEKINNNNAKVAEKEEELNKLLNILNIFICDEDALGLGNQTSQAMALYYLNAIDHKASEFGFYGRYMDDFYCMCESRERAEEMLEFMKKEVEKLKLKLNKDKCKIQSIKRSKITFLKRVHYFQKPRNNNNNNSNNNAPTGKLIVRMCKKTKQNTRRHLKGVRHLVTLGVLDPCDLGSVVNSLYTDTLTHPSALQIKILTEAGMLLLPEKTGEGNKNEK